MSNSGKRIDIRGDVATCGHCDGSWPIIATAEHMKDNGRSIALHGDWVACPCKKNRVVAIAENMRYGDQGNNAVKVTAIDAAHSSFQSSAETVKRKHTQYISVKDSSIGEPMRNQPFVVEVQGEMQSERTDDEGYATIETSGSKTFRIHIVFSAPKRDLIPLHGN
jgi:hypothetical protein